MKILGVSGSLRKDSFNSRLLSAGAKFLEKPAFIEIYNISRIPFYNEDVEREAKPEFVQSWLDAIEDSDALLFASPEYNHSVPGVLKNAIDWASRPGFKSVLVGKPTGILSASMSSVGGARAQSHLKVILASTLTPVYPAPDYLLPIAQEAFDADGRLKHETAARRLRRYMNEFVVWANTFD
jgi:chromate reductase